MERINIPTATPAIQAASVVIVAFRQAGIDPKKAFANEMCRALAMEWSRGGMDDGQFQRACANLLILNPALGEMA